MPRKKNVNTIENPVASAQSQLCTKKNSVKNSSIAEEDEKLAVYEFTFDPNEEPAPPKKQKRKRTQKKKEIKSKIWSTATRCNYDKNVNLKLNQLRKLVLSKNTNTNSMSSSNKSNQLPADHKSSAVQEETQNINLTTCDQIATEPQEVNKIVDTNITPKPIASRRISVLSDVSFFDVQPIANSSFNSIKSPAGASPWRVDIDVGPKKWPVNFYVKPNMTPAYDSSFAEVGSIQNRESRIKYAPIIISPSKSPLKTAPCIFEDVTNTASDCNSRLKQTSMISFIQQKVLNKSDKKSSTKKKKVLENITPTKDNSLFNESCASAEKTSVTTKLRSSTIRNLNFDCPIKDINRENDQRHITHKENTTDENRNITKKKKSDIFFGFDDSDIIDRENISPEEIVKKNHVGRKTKLQLRKALKEVNEIQGPMRANINVHGTKDVLFDQIAQKQIEKGNCDNKQETDQGGDVETEEVALFEDLDCIQHQHRLERKSYGGKPRQQRNETVNTSDSDSDMSVTSNKLDEDVCEEPENFTYLDVEKNERRTRTKKRKKPLSKKEKKEADHWARSFNSMLEEANEFQLLVE